MNKSRFVFWFFAILLLLLTCALGDIISIGERIYNVSKVLGLLYCAILFTILLFSIIIPIVRVFFTPEIKGEVTFEPKILAELKESVKDSAKLSMIITMLSQKGSIDMLANTAISFKMIGHLVKSAGHRPNFSQLFRLYSTVLTASWIVASADEFLDTLDIGDIINNAGVGAMCKIFQPLANGVTNAYTCLRIGYATIKYLELGGKQFRDQRVALRRIIAKEAMIDIIPIMKSQTSDVIKKYMHV